MTSSGGYACPACAAEGRQTRLGAQPWAGGKLQPDLLLGALIRKVLPDAVRERLIWQRVQVRAASSAPAAGALALWPLPAEVALAAGCLKSRLPSERRQPGLEQLHTFLCPGKVWHCLGERCHLTGDGCDTESCCLACAV